MVTRNPLLTPDNTLSLDGWIQRINKDRPLSEQQAILQACHFAQQVHQSQILPSGQPYLVHVITVADLLAELGMDTEVLVAAILHDVVENKQVSLEEIEKNFGPIVTRLVDGVTKMKGIEGLNDHTQRPEEQQSQIENLRKMLLAMAEDIRVVFIKLADRLDNMRNLRHLPEPVQQRVARETLDLFAPLANRLGIGQIKWELEDLSLRYLEPEIYQRLARLLAERRVSRENYIDQVIHLLKESLAKVGIKAEVSGRPKHLYSIWRKMQRKGLDFDQIFDVRAVRVLVNTINECYMALGVVHNHWQPIPGEFDDYIATPKNNDYQSLHTAVLGPEQKIFEVQIRTYNMHHHAELGVASHWRYKEGGTPQDKNFEQKIAWLRKMLQWKDEENNPGELLDRFKSEIFEDTVYVISPQGKVVELPLGATPLDFAYYIHTQLGHCCRGAKVNQRMVPLTYVLKSGDQVEILSSKEERPSRDWLVPYIGYLKTSRARAKVRQWFKKQNLQQHINDGRILLERELRRLNIREYNLEKLANTLNFKIVDELFASLGRGDTTLSQVANIFREQVLPPRRKLPIVAEPSQPHIGNIYIKGVPGLLTQMAGCCKPIPPDSIVGYITKGRGVVVHRRDCYNALRWQDEGNERLIEVQWSQSKDEKTLYPVDISVQAYDRPGLLHDICSIVANGKINILATNTLTDKTDNSANLTFTLEVIDLEQLSGALAKIDRLPNVMKVWRKNSG
jgi:GTP pyrophosphokinase